MRLHKRTIRTISDHKIIQLMLENGKIVAEFHDPDMYDMFCAGAKGVSIYSEDICQFVVVHPEEVKK